MSYQDTLEEFVTSHMVLLKTHLTLANLLTDIADFNGEGDSERDSEGETTIERIQTFRKGLNGEEKEIPFSDLPAPLQEILKGIIERIKASQ